MNLLKMYVTLIADLGKADCSRGSYGKVRVNFRSSETVVLFHEITSPEEQQNNRPVVYQRCVC